MIAALFEDELGALARRADVLAQVDAVDRTPDLAGRGHGVSVGEPGVAVEIGPRILEDRGAQRQESIDVPRLDIGFVRVHVDREVEEIRDEHTRGPAGRDLARLEHVQAFDDHDVGPVDDLVVAGHDVVRLMRVDRRSHVGLADAHGGHELDQPPHVVALRKPLAREQAALLEHGVREQEPVGGDEIDTRMRPSSVLRAS